jgi:hypothetical protein
VEQVEQVELSSSRFVEVAVCNNPGCSSKSGDLCGGCGMVRYCSKACPGALARAQTSLQRAPREKMS